MTATTTTSARTTSSATLINTPMPTEQFAQNLIGTINQASLAMMLSIGHRTGLFDTMAEMDRHATSMEIADAASLNERYVREWLGAMVTSAVVIYNPTAKTYHLPAQHAAMLTRAAMGNNMANTMQWISVLGSVEDRVVESFKQGGGVPYQCFHRFHEVMASESMHTVVTALDEDILPLAAGLHDKLTAGIDVLEIGCGMGQPSAWLAEKYPNSTFRGYDLCDDAIAAGMAKHGEKNLTNLTLESRDITTLDETNTCDLVLAFDVIHDQKEPATVLANIRRALRPGGTFLMQDIAASSYLENNVDHMLGTMFYTISTMHCMTVSLAQGGAGLGTVWGRELAEQMLAEAGFKNVDTHTLDHDVMNHYYLAS